MADKPQCVFCKRDQAQVPLIALMVKDQEAWICPQDLPVLIHEPKKLVGKLAGVENLIPQDQ